MNAWQLVPTQYFFSSTSTVSGSNNNDNMNNGESNDTPSVSSGQASITLEGGWTEEEKDRTQKEEKTEDTESSLYTNPIVVEMPQVDASDSGENFFVEKWHKRPGDFLEKDDVLCEIATPDFVFGMQIDDEETGIMGEIHAEEGVKVACHAPICTIYHKDDE